MILARWDVFKVAIIDERRGETSAAAEENHSFGDEQ
jgi:hypothetical protein